METYFPNIEAAYRGLSRERVVADLQDLIREAEEWLRAPTGSEVSPESRARLEGAIQRARATCAQLEREGRTAWRAAVRRAETAVREHPYPALGVAFGLGVLIGALVARR